MALNNNLCYLSCFRERERENEVCVENVHKSELMKKSKKKNKEKLNNTSASSTTTTLHEVAQKDEKKQKNYEEITKQKLPYTSSSAREKLYKFFRVFFVDATFMYFAFDSE